MFNVLNSYAHSGANIFFYKTCFKNVYKLVSPEIIQNSATEMVASLIEIA